MSAGPHAIYTAEEDAAIRAGLAAGRSYRAIAAELGRSRSGVMARAAALERRPLAPPAVVPGRRPDAWTPAQREYLRTWWGVRPDGEVAAALGERGPRRTVKACMEEAHDLGLRRRSNSLTLPEVARVFGMTTETVDRWARTRLLRAQKRPVRWASGLLWHVPDAALRRFVREHGHPYDLQRMAAGHWLTAYAGEVLGGEWLRLPEAAVLVHYSWESVWRWVQLGDLAARSLARRQRHTPLVVRRTDLLAAAAAHDDRWRERMSASQQRRRHG